jgi:hypothetical protein
MCVCAHAKHSCGVQLDVFALVCCMSRYTPSGFSKRKKRKSPSFVYIEKIIDI